VDSTLFAARPGCQAGVVARLSDPRLSFNAVARVYDEIRPAYPARLFDDLFAHLPSRPEVIEVGPGTGQATRDLLDRGARVHAIEIGSAMADILRANLPSERLQISVGDYEELVIPARSADAVFSATAYHWVSPTAQVDRPATILKPGALIAIVDLVHVDAPEDKGFFAAIQPIYQQYGGGHAGPPAPTRDTVDPPMRQALEADHRFVDVQVRRYDWDQTYSAADFRKLMVSYSGTQMMDEADRTGLLDDIESFAHEQFDGRVTRPLVVTLTTARLASGPTATERPSGMAHRGLAVGWPGPTTSMPST
jgi:trans-aconitate methyltransferase